ncbi:MAG: M50 family metallopeptidase [Kofleriaceae bacterium]
MTFSGILLAILALGFLIVVHESGHYFVARWCKMRVERFSVGFGPGILKRRAKSGTVFQLAPIPFGGFVEIRGMNIAEEVDPEDVHAYPNRPAWQRFVTILAGPATNYISAIFIVFGLYTCQGMRGSTWHVQNIDDSYDAKGKFQPGDRIVAIDGHDMFGPSSPELSKVINATQGKPVQITVQRNYALVNLTITPKLAVDDKGEEILDKDKKRQYRMGIMQIPDLVDVGIGEALVGAIRYPVDQTKVIFGGFRDIFTGKEQADPGGPVRIVKEFETAFSRGIGDGFGLLAMLSVYLGLFNLLPLPALDGGRLVFLGYEMVTRRRANPKIETMVHMGGIMVLMIVMILVTLHDFNVI